MHEMSIALSIIDLAADQAGKAGAEKIVEVELDIGTLSGVQIDALSFALDIAARDTVMESASIKINRIEAMSECMDCGHLFDAAGYVNQCPKCKEMNTFIRKGKEMLVKSLLVE
jgi:hydrogenase nickel incorporation protein HypA/HybF